MSNTPKQDLTVEELGNLDDVVLIHKTVGLRYPLLTERLIAAARQHIEAQEAEAPCRLEVNSNGTRCVVHSPQKPEPSGEREDADLVGPNGKPLACCPNCGIVEVPHIKVAEGCENVASDVPSPTPGDKDAVTAEDLAKGFVAFKDGKKITAEELYEPSPSGSVEHELKVWPASFAEVEAGRKLFEVRYNDRGYKVGDRLRLREYEPGPDTYTGREVRETIAYIIKDTDFPFGAAALKPGYCVLGLSAERMEQERDELYENNGWCANEIGRLEAEKSRLSLEVGRRNELLQKLLDGIDNGAVSLDSFDVGGDRDCPPHPWHEEWLHHVRNALAGGAEK